MIDALAHATDPAPLMPGGGALRVEVDIPRQVLLVYQNDGLSRIINTSTGTGRHYCAEDGSGCSIAVTPSGSFHITSRINGWHKSHLGELLNPLFFNRGIAIHGATAVPAYPASHGCVRVSEYVAGWLPGMLPNGTPVYVVGGFKGPLPPTTPDPNATTTTTSTTAPPTPSTPAPPPTSSSTPTTAAPATSTTKP
jgi:hypothetical protein